MKKKILEIDHFLERHIFLALLLLCIAILRIPNFFEPYWYGDEGIYLTLGQAMRRGIRLYSEIIDHKTPLIYFFAMVKSQLGFRALNLVWMLATTTSFYIIVKKLLTSKAAQIVALVLFGIFTTIPMFEGNIPNGELFVMGFALTGLAVLLHTPFGKLFLSEKHTKKKLQHKPKLYVLSGALFSLGILTKVPGLFDAVAAMSIVYLVGLWELKPKLAKNVTQHLISLAQKLFPVVLWFSVGVVVPIILSALYFILRGSGQAYLDFGLLYNFRYAGSWTLPFENPLLLFLFTLPGKVVVLAIALIAVSFLQNKKLQFGILWMLLTLVASTLSNRPYAHYFLQVIPAAAMIVALFVDQLFANKLLLPNISLSAVSIALFVATLFLLQVWTYPTVSYYSNFIRYATGSLPQSEYYMSFDRLMNDNYKAARRIRAENPERIFIWGTNPMLYALSGASPTGRFTVSFHIKDFDAYDETIQSVYDHEPPFVVMMHNETYTFNRLEAYLAEHYIQSMEYDNFDLWIRKQSEM